MEFCVVISGSQSVTSLNLVCGVCSQWTFSGKVGQMLSIPLIRIFHHDIPFSWSIRLLYAELAKSVIELPKYITPLYTRSGDLQAACWWNILDVFLHFHTCKGTILTTYAVDICIFIQSDVRMIKSSPKHDGRLSMNDELFLGFFTPFPLHPIGRLSVRGDSVIDMMESRL